MAAIHRDFEYAPNAARAWTRRSTRRWSARRGVCQDFAHIMIAALRRLGLPCRYVSGYIAPHAGRRRSATSRRAPRTRGSRCCLPDARLGRPRPDAQHARPASATSASPSDATTPIVPPTRGVFKGGAGSTLTVRRGGQPRRCARRARPPMLPEPQWATEAAAVPRMTNASGKAAAATAAVGIEARLGLISLGRQRRTSCAGRCFAP